MIITHRQAVEAVKIVEHLVTDCFGEDLEKYTATQINVHPSIVKSMYDLIKEIRGNR